MRGCSEAIEGAKPGVGTAAIEETLRGCSKVIEGDKPVDEVASCPPAGASMLLCRTNGEMLRGCSQGIEGGKPGEDTVTCPAASASALLCCTIEEVLPGCSQGIEGGKPDELPELPEEVAEAPAAMFTTGCGGSLNDSCPSALGPSGS